MSRTCELTAKAVLTGNNVSHANNKTKRRFLPNLVNVTLISEALNQNVRLRISANALRSVEHRGGLDAFLAKADAKELSQRARLLEEADRQEAGRAAGRLRFSRRGTTALGIGSKSAKRFSAIRCSNKASAVRIGMALRWFHYPG